MVARFWRQKRIFANSKNHTISEGVGQRILRKSAASGSGMIDSKTRKSFVTRVKLWAKKRAAFPRENQMQEPSKKGG